MPCRSEESETDSVLEGAPPSTAPPPQTSIIAPLSPVKVSHLTNEQEDSPWDSERSAVLCAEPKIFLQGAGFIVSIIIEVVSCYSEASGDDVGVTNRLTSDNTKQVRTLHLATHVIVVMITAACYDQ